VGPRAYEQKSYLQFGHGKGQGDPNEVDGKPQGASAWESISPTWTGQERFPKSYLDA